jgi:subtilisin-like proprotein convertase family protein
MVVRYIPSDPYYSQQWHLGMIGRLGATGFEGLERVWANYRGLGINVGVWDDGVEQIHWDLDGNYDASLHVNVAGVGLNDGQPLTSTDGHGTSVGGLIAAENNGQGGVGVAFWADLTGVRIFGGAYDINSQYGNYLASLDSLRNFDVTNHSYGMSSQYYHFGPYSDDRIPAVVDSLQNGRGGLGTINLAAAGNNDAMNGEKWKHHRGVITVAATDEYGDAAWYSSYGPNVLVAAPAGSVTTDRLGAGNGYDSSGLGVDYTDAFGGTSAATPVTSGLVSLLLSAAPGLGARDVQSILAMSAVGTGTFDGPGYLYENFSWRYNGAKEWNGGGLHYSEDYGFGLINAFQATRLAESWLRTTGGAAHTSANEYSVSTVTHTPNLGIPDLALTSYQFSVSASIDIETVSLSVGLHHANFAELRMWLVSPSGTRVQMLDADVGTGGVNSGTNWSFTFNLQGFRGESTAGNWTLEVEDTQSASIGILQSVQMTAYGQSDADDDTYVYTDEVLTVQSQDAGRVTLTDADDGVDWINAAANHRTLSINLAAGGSSTLDGVTFLTIAAGTTIENVIAGDADDTILGNGVANEIDGGRGADSMTGLGGADTYFVDDALDDVYEAAGGGFDTVRTSVSHALTAGQEIEILAVAGGSGTTFAINLTGNSFGQTIYGNAGANIIDGLGGVDHMYGYGGNDTYYVDNAGDRVYESAGAGHDQVGASVSYTLAAGQSIENMWISTSGAFNLTGNEFGQVLWGNGDNNTLDGRGGADTMFGLTGNDTFFVDDVGDQTYENSGAGFDTVRASLSYTLLAFSEIEVLAVAGGSGTSFAIDLTGNSYGQTIYGNAAGNTIDGQGGVDHLYGYGGDDVYIVDMAGDRAYETATGGYDTLFASVNYVLQAGQYVESLGVAMHVWTAAVNLTGNAFSQSLVGGAGANVLDGGGGADYLFGLAGDDTYFVDNAGDIVFESPGAGNDMVRTSRTSRPWPDRARSI